MRWSIEKTREYNLSPAQIALARTCLLAQVEQSTPIKKDRRSPLEKLEEHLQRQADQTGPKDKTITVSLRRRQRDLLLDVLPVTAEATEAAANDTMLMAVGEINDGINLATMGESGRAQLETEMQEYKLKLMLEAGVLYRLLRGNE